MKKQRFMTLAHDHVSGKKSSQEHTPSSLDHLKTLKTYKNQWKINVFHALLCFILSALLTHGIL